MQEEDPRPSKFREDASIVITGFTVVAATVVCLWAVWRISQHQRFWDDFIYDHFAALIGIPAAAGAAFVLVSILRQLDGPIEFEFSGFKAKGSTGQVILWVICFLSFVFAMNMLWDKSAVPNHVAQGDPKGDSNSLK